MSPDAADIIERMNEEVVRLHGERAFDRALDLAREADARARDGLPEGHRLRLVCRLNLAAVQLALGRTEEVDRLTQESVGVERAVTQAAGATGAGPDPIDLSRLEQLLTYLARHAEASRDREHAAANWDDVACFRARRLGPDHWEVVDARLKARRLHVLAALPPSRRARLLRAIRLNSRAVAHFYRGEYRRALTLVRKSWQCGRGEAEAESFFHVPCMHNLAKFLQANGQIELADRAFRRCRVLQRKSTGVLHPDYATYLCEHAEVVRQLGRYPEAEAMLGRAVRVLAATRGERNSVYANALNDLAVHYHWQSDLARAKKYYERALADYEALGQSSRPFVTLLCNMTKLYQRLREYDQAEKLGRRALAMARGLGEGSALVAECLSVLATVANERGDHAGCQAMLREAIALLERLNGPDDVAMADELRELGLSLRDTSDFRESDECLRRALAIYRRVLADYEALGQSSHPFVTLLCNMTKLYQRFQEYDQAEKLGRRALALACGLGEGSALVAGCLSVLATVANERGDHAGCQAMLREAIALLERLNGPDDVAMADELGKLGLSLQTSGDFRESEECLQRALAIYRRNRSPNPLDIAIILIRLGSHYELVGDFPKSRHYFQEALDIRTRALGDRHAHVARPLDLLGGVLEKEGDDDAALDTLRRAADIRRERFGEDHRDYAMSLSHLGLLHSKRGEFADAESCLSRALEIRRRVVGEDHDDYATSLNNLGSLYQHTGRFDEALPLYERAYEIYRRKLGDDHPHVALALGNLGLLLAGSGDLSGALNRLRQANRIDERTIRSVLTLIPERQRLTYLSRLQAHLTALLSLAVRTNGADPEVVKAAFEVLLRRKGLVAEVFAFQRDVTLGGHYPHLQEPLGHLYALRREIAGAVMAGPRGVSPEEHRQRIDALLARQEALETKLIRQVPEAELGRHLECAGLASVAQAVPEDSALVEFAKTIVFPLDRGIRMGQPGFSLERYLAFVVCPGNPPRVSFHDLGDAQEIDLLIRGFRQTLTSWAGMVGAGRHVRFEPPGSGEGETGPGPGVRLRAAVFDPIVAKLDGRSRLLLAPDAELNLLPFETLPLGDGRLVIDAYAVSYLAVGRDVLRLAPSTAEPPFPAGDPVVIADPDFDLAEARRSLAPGPATVGPRPGWEQVTGFDRLEGTHEEGREVAARLGVEPLLGADALKGRLEGVHSPRVLHFATHGFVLPDPVTDVASQAVPGGGASEAVPVENLLLRSGLALAGANTWLHGGTLPEAARNGILSAEDVTGLDLVGTELVVLSACDTGLGRVHAGEGVFGLRRAFALAGARTLVMSLWIVPDHATKELMVEFYRRILVGEPRASALREAQRTLRERYPHPRDWGAFICQGDSGPLPQAGRHPRQDSGG